MWVRVDNRLVHGQVVESWVPHTQAKAIWVVNDELYEDTLRQEIMGLAIPHGVEIEFSRPSEIVEALKSFYGNGEDLDILILFVDCQDAKKAYEHGLMFTTLNIANIHYSSGKTQICDHVALNDDDITCVGFFNRRGVRLDFRCLPNKPVQVRAIW